MIWGWTYKYRMLRDAGRRVEVSMGYSFEASGYRDAKTVIYKLEETV
jgi:hypothetical protein